MPRVRVGQRTLHPRHKLFDALLEQALDELVFVGKMAVHGGHADAGVVGDVVQRGAQAALRKEVPRGLEDPLAVPDGVLAQRLDRNRLGAAVSGLVVFVALGRRGRWRSLTWHRSHGSKADRSYPLTC
jgi:hypothetical protein